jgi:membrane associated rhomboid family serine protease
VPLVFLLAAAVGNEASLWLLDKPSVGASGGLLGWLGFLLVFESLHSRLVPRSARRRLLAGVFLTALIGLVGYQFIDNAAHAGGLLAGMLYAVIVFPSSSSAMRPGTNKTDLVAGGLAFLVLALCCCLAVWKIVSA